MRRGNWTYVHTRYDGPRWQLDGTTLQLEHDSANRMGDSPNGMWDLYSPGRFVAHVDGYLDGAMEHVEEHLAEYFAVDCLRCRRTLVDRDELGWYYQTPVTSPEAPGLTFMDRVHKCEGEPHLLGEGVAERAEALEEVRQAAETERYKAWLTKQHEEG